VLQLDAESWRGLSRRPRVATVPQPLRMYARCISLTEATC